MGDSLATSPKNIDAYAPLHEKMSAQRESGYQMQPGDPVLGAVAIIKALTSEHPPLHLLLGSDAYEAAMKQLHSLKSEFEVWKELTFSTDIKE